MQSVQNRNGRIETSDEIVLRMLHENWFYDTIQIVPGTLPKPIPKNGFPQDLNKMKKGIWNKFSKDSDGIIYWT